MSPSQAVQLFVVIVDFVVQREHADAFARLMVDNAQASRTLEEGCIQFDVCRPADDPTRFFLYELYKDAEAFPQAAKARDCLYGSSPRSVCTHRTSGSASDVSDGGQQSRGR